MAQAFAQEITPPVVEVTPEGEVAHEPAAGEVHAATEAHGEDAAHGVFPPFDPATFGSQLLWLALTFGALYLLMSRVALPRIGSILADRKARIDADLAEADTMRQQTDAAIAKYEADLAAARAKAQAIAEETRQGIRAEIDGKRKAVEADLSRTVAEAEARIQASKQAALTHVDEIATETAQALVGRLVGEVSPAAAKEAVLKVIQEQANAV